MTVALYARRHADPDEPMLRLRCHGCGYGVSVRRTPKRCPMCGTSDWAPEGWETVEDLVGDLNRTLGRT